MSYFSALETLKSQFLVYIHLIILVFLTIAFELEACNWETIASHLRYYRIPLRDERRGDL